MFANDDNAPAIFGQDSSSKTYLCSRNLKQHKEKK